MKNKNFLYIAFLCFIYSVILNLGLYGLHTQAMCPIDPETGYCQPADTGDGTVQLSLDSDKDGIKDLQDNCPDVANKDQLNTDKDTNGGDACDDDDDNDGVLDVNDCAPTDTTKWKSANYYLDSDGDAYGSGSAVAICGDNNYKPAGYSSNNTDNCSAVSNPDQKNTDNDLKGDACDLDDDSDRVADTQDCAPTDASKWKSANYYLDSDNDSYGSDSGQSVCVGNSMPQGYSSNNTDNCPDISNADQQDSNNNGVGDACDTTSSADFSIMEDPNTDFTIPSSTTYYLDPTESSVFQNTVKTEYAGRLSGYDNSWSANGWLQGPNVGWVSLYCDANSQNNMNINCGNYPYEVKTTGDMYLYGNAWSDTCGWLYFERVDSKSLGVKINLGNKVLQGKISSDNCGYISFDNIKLVDNLEMIQEESQAEIIAVEDNVEAPTIETKIEDSDQDGISDLEEGRVYDKNYVAISYDVCPDGYICTDGACQPQVQSEKEQNIDLYINKFGIDDKNKNSFYIDICSGDSQTSDADYKISINNKESTTSYYEGIPASTCQRMYSENFDFYGIDSAVKQCYQAKATVDSEENVDESNESNNSISKQFCFGPDLYISDAGIDTVMPDNFYVDVCAANTDISNVDFSVKADKTKLTFNYSNTIPQNECVRLYTSSVSNFNLSSDSSGYKLKAEVDPKNTIKESNEDNNKFEKDKQDKSTVSYFLNVIGQYLKADITSPVCTDSDGGLNKNEFGYTIDSDGGQHNDSCSGTAGVIENYCDGSQSLFKTISCNADEICQNGLCVAKEENSPSIICTETDNGYDLYQKGTNTGILYITGEQVSLTDTCTSQSEIMEVYCFEPQPIYDYYPYVSKDTDSDGTPDYEDNDSDNDTILDVTETSVDTDADGTPDYIDTDSDGDGMGDSLEMYSDPDGDNVPNFRDQDSNDNNLPDAKENTDSNNNGIIDAYEYNVYIVAKIYPDPNNYNVYAGDENGYTIELSNVPSSLGEISNLEITAVNTLRADQTTDNPESQTPYQPIIKKDDNISNKWHITSAVPTGISGNDHCGSKDYNYLYAVSGLKAEVDGVKYPINLSNGFNYDSNADTKKDSLLLNFDNPIKINSINVNGLPYFNTINGIDQNINIDVTLNNQALSSANIIYALSAETIDDGTPITFQFKGESSTKTVNYDTSTISKLIAVADTDSTTEIVNELLTAKSNYTVDQNGSSVLVETCQMSLPKSTDSSANIFTNYNINISGIISGSSNNIAISIGNEGQNAIRNLNANIAKFTRNSSTGSIDIGNENIRITEGDLKLTDSNDNGDDIIQTYIVKGANVYLTGDITNAKLVIIAEKNQYGKNGNIYIGNNVQYLMSVSLVAEGGVYRYDQENSDLPDSVPDRRSFIVKDQFLIAGNIISENNILTSSTPYANLSPADQNKDLRGLSDFGCIARVADDVGNPEGANSSKCKNISDDSPLQYSGLPIDAQYNLNPYTKSQDQYSYPVFILYSVIDSVLFK
ncbi:hypothetical protein A2272_00180 [Candidatus Peregrinibacteria bacterium RIFOXYA12_FULL_33_12]|nr:MAG: hypothetical protein A2263_03295 [Candidatus Peregrinibacteria bacterium RIFOXYA2_FULL_33_21]OGJ46534.1 MAG: hypothetical protein A2272_00180 [Candidatus Peregrinibacteria bacterium RIFOXYA12_FULL_33_12]